MLASSRIALGPALAALLALACDTRSPAGAPALPADPAPAALPTVPAGHLVSAGSLDRALRRGTQEQWFGLYFKDKKIGYATFSLRPQPASGADPAAMLWAVDATIRMGGLGQSSVAKMREERRYAAAPPHALLDVRSREESDGSRVERVYRNGPDGMVISISADGKPQPDRQVPRSQETLLSLLDQQLVEPADVKPGATVTVVEFDSQSEKDKPTVVKVADVRKQRLAGVDTQVVVLSSQSEGEQTITEAVLASGGVAISASMGEGMDLRFEEKARAESDVVGFDMLRDALVVDRPLGEPSAVHELDMVVGVARNFTLRDAPNQEIDRLPGGKLRVQLRSRPGLPVMPAERAAALQPSASADSGAPAIARLAAEITADAGDPDEKVRRLVDWVYKNLEKDLATNLGTASQVLEHRAGDCTEHALLFVALARAAGIPAREVSGLVYMGDSVRRFGWHAWAEVEAGGRWVQVDPSWGEALANATHLTLGVGEDSDWVTTMASLTIELGDPPP